MKRIAVLTSGGDAPGMNAALRAVVRAALVADIETYGVRWGYEGLLSNDLAPIDRSQIVNIVHRGGTVLGSARSERFRTPQGRAMAVETLKRHRIDGLVVIGGDGTFRGAGNLSAEGGPPTVGIPATIDNDVAGTDTTLGFDTAINTALDAIDRVRDTSASHAIVHFVEVMGRNCGEIALASGVAGGAEAVLIPEEPIDVAALATSIAASRLDGKRAVLIVVAEGVAEGGARTIALQLADYIDVDYRVTVLGHVQRGGAPSAADRTLAAIFGVHAVTVLCAGGSSVSVGVVNGELVTTPFNEAELHPHVLDPHLRMVAEILS